MKYLVNIFALGLLPLAVMAASAAPESSTGPLAAPVRSASTPPALPNSSLGVIPAAPAAPAAVAPAVVPVPAALAPAVAVSSPEKPQAVPAPVIAPTVPRVQPAQQARRPAARTKPVESLEVPLVAAAVVPPLERVAFANESRGFTVQEQASLAIARRWREAGNASALTSVAGPDGTVRFLFGATQPSVVCAVFQVCDIELQRGEQVNAVNLGDAIRWSVDPAVSGSGANEVIHLVVKPLDVDLETTLMVATNRRTYHIRLRSHKSEYIPRVAFIYPEDAAAKWDAISKREATEKADATIPATGETIGELNFDYRVDGSAPWKPVRVYNNGQKTFIQMPASVSQSEAPTLMLVRKEGGIFTEEETAMVNYRFQNDRFIVDAIFERAILIAGVGSSQDRITITRGK